MLVDAAVTIEDESAVVERGETGVLLSLDGVQVVGALMTTGEEKDWLVNGATGVLLCSVWLEGLCPVSLEV